MLVQVYPIPRCTTGCVTGRVGIVPRTDATPPPAIRQQAIRVVHIPMVEAPRRGPRMIVPAAGGVAVLVVQAKAGCRLSPCPAIPISIRLAGKRPRFDIHDGNHGGSPARCGNLCHGPVVQFPHADTNRSKGVAMNWDIIEGKWNQLKGSIREKWGDLTDDELTEVAGKKDKLAGKLQEKYGWTKEKADEQIDHFFRDKT